MTPETLTAIKPTVMTRLAFSPIAHEAPLAKLADGTRMPAGVDATRRFKAIASPSRAGPDDVTVYLEGDDPGDLAASRAGACFVAEKHAALVPRRILPLITEDPLKAVQRALMVFFPRTEASSSAFGRRGIDPAAVVHGDAVLERNVIVDPGAVVGPHVEIGAGTAIGANAVIGAGVRIGRGCIVDPLVCIDAALIGDRVIIHAGARIGIEPTGGRHVGRVILQDDVEIGANAVIERGLLDDTMIGDHATVEALAVVVAGTLIDRPEK